MTENSFDGIINNVAKYYDDKINTHGATAKGVDWNSRESQQLRFAQLMKICGTEERLSINDYGCGYGALIDYIIEKGYVFTYSGFDISHEMIAKAREKHDHLISCEFYNDETNLLSADYTVASGIFNVKLDRNDEEWREYIISILEKIAKLSKRGFSFNMLTKYSDMEYMRKDLYYADPLFVFDYCKRNFSKYVALLHDYPLFEFTILVRY